jgi:hypothetical protein
MGKTGAIRPRLSDTNPDYDIFNSCLLLSP